MKVERMSAYWTGPTAWHAEHYARLSVKVRRVIRVEPDVLGVRVLVEHDGPTDAVRAAAEWYPSGMFKGPEDP